MTSNAFHTYQLAYSSPEYCGITDAYLCHSYDDVEQMVCPRSAAMIAADRNAVGCDEGYDEGRWVVLDSEGDQMEFDDRNTAFVLHIKINGDLWPVEVEPDYACIQQRARSLKKAGWEVVCKEHTFLPIAKWSFSRLREVCQNRRDKLEDLHSDL